MRRGLAILAVTALGAVTVSACSGGGSGKARDAASAFLAAWAKGDTAAAARRTDSPTAAKTALDQVKDALEASPTASKLTVGDVSTSHGRGTARYRATWSIGMATPWQYAGSLALVKKKDWTVHWQQSDVHPKLRAGDRLSVTRTLPDRASILDATGQPLFASTDVVKVGVVPGQVADPAAFTQAVSPALAQFGVTADDVTKAATNPHKDQYILIVTLRATDYAKIRNQIHEVPGLQFRNDKKLLTPTPSFGQPLLGRVGDATADIVRQEPDLRPGDQAGLSGLQRIYDTQLAGKAGGRIDAKPASGNITVNLATIQPRPGTPLKTTLDLKAQAAAEKALTTVGQQAAILAIRPSTGEVVAVANSAGVTTNIALSGRYPAGSDFKIISAAAALDGGAAKPTDPVACPGTITVGKVFQNENQFDKGTVPVRMAFAFSCNTSFIALTGKLPKDAVPTMAARFGIGTEWQLGVDNFGGSVPVPADDTERAADTIGQGKVQVSPLAMALVAATVVKGATPVPTLVAGHPGTPKKPPPAPPAAVLPSLRDFMRAVVTDGTATDLKALPGGVSGKTGTAEYGTDVPPRSHAWFVGFRGDLAFAVLVVDGQSSHKTAVPVAKAFLTGF
ncbi:MAG: penicillin-binding transpeptidase domain-containing protein [Mycobacteriales bacterium]